MDESAKQGEVQKLYRIRDVNVADGWGERLCTYPRRSHAGVPLDESNRRVLTNHEKSADGIVPGNMELRGRPEVNNRCIDASRGPNNSGNSSEAQKQKETAELNPEVRVGEWG